MSLENESNAIIEVYEIDSSNLAVKTLCRDVHDRYRFLRTVD